MAIRDTFIIRTEWFEAINELKPSEQALVLRNLFYFHNDQEAKIKLPNLSVKLVWKLIEPNLKRNIDNYDKRRETSSENGRKGGRPKNLNNLNKPNEKPNNLPENLTEPNNPIVSVSDSVSDSVTPAIPTDAAKEFEIFWNAYGKKTDRNRCEHEWFNMEPEERAKALKMAPVYARSQPDAKFRKTPLNWLEGKCWNDEALTELPDTVKYLNAAAGGYGTMSRAEWNRLHANNPNTTLQLVTQ